MDVHYCVAAIMGLSGRCPSLESDGLLYSCHSFQEGAYLSRFKKTLSKHPFRVDWEEERTRGSMCIAKHSENENAVAGSNSIWSDD